MNPIERTEGYNAQVLRTLYTMYRKRCTNQQIADALGKTKEAINAKIRKEIRAGRLQRIFRKKGARNTLWNKNQAMMLPPEEPFEVIKCPETGAHIKRYRPGYCRGVWPQKNVKVVV